MVAAVTAASVGLPSLGDAAAAELISSPMVFASQTPAPTSVACHFGNAGGKTIRITDRKIFKRDGRTVPLTTNTCGSPDGFNLAPRSTCTIAGAATALTSFGCKAGANDAGPIRASIELRDAGPRTFRATPLTVGVGSASATEFQTISSTAMFGAPSQRDAACEITNAGTTPARLKDHEIRSSTGLVVPTTVVGCAGGATTVIPPGKSCVVYASPVPALDLQCRVSVTRKANIRGAFFLLNMTEVLNWKPVR